jgi:hypothetical protein
MTEDNPRASPFVAPAGVQSNNGILSSMLVCIECRRLELRYAAAVQLCGRYTSSLDSVPLENDQLSRALLVRQKTADHLSLHRQDCQIYQALNRTIPLH